MKLGRLSSLAFTLVVTLFWGACKEKQSTPSEPTPEPPKPVAPRLPRTPYPALAKAIQVTALALQQGHCKNKQPRSCQGYGEAVKLISPKGRGKGLQTLETMGLLLNVNDSAVVEVTGSLFGERAMNEVNRTIQLLATRKQKINPKVVDPLIRGLAKIDGHAATVVATFAAWAAPLAGRVPQLSRVSDRHKNVHVRRRVLRQVMRFGRLAAFSYVERCAKDKDVGVARAAVKSPLNMFRWTEEEQRKLCPWAQGFLSHPDLQLATHAGHLMNRCKADGTYVEALLAEGKRRIAIGQWKMPFDFPYRDICFGGFLGKDRKASTKLCEKTYAFLQSVTDNEKVDPRMRARALDWIVYQRRDKKSYALLKRYKNHKVKEIAKVAADGMQMLEKSYLKKKKSS